MRVIFSVLGMWLLASCAATYEMPAAVSENAVDADYQVVYTPEAGVWSAGGMAEGRIVFTKTVSSGSGSYSEYSNGKISFSPNSTYEYLYNGRLIGYNEHTLQFTEVIYRDGKFVTEILTPQQVRQLFPGLEVITVSSAANGVITVKKPVFGAKTFLLVNDTDNFYYRYSFNGSCFESNPVFKSMLTVEHSGFIVFSHYGSRDPMFPILTINVEDGL